MGGGPEVSEVTETANANVALANDREGFTSIRRSGADYDPRSIISEYSGRPSEVPLGRDYLINETEAPITTYQISQTETLGEKLALWAEFFWNGVKIAGKSIYNLLVGQLHDAGFMDILGGIASFDWEKIKGGLWKGVEYYGLKQIYDGIQMISRGEAGGWSTMFAGLGHLVVKGALTWLTVTGLMALPAAISGTGALIAAGIFIARGMATGTAAKAVILQAIKGGATLIGEQGGKEMAERVVAGGVVRIEATVTAQLSGKVESQLVAAANKGAQGADEFNGILRESIKKAEDKLVGLELKQLQNQARIEARHIFKDLNEGVTNLPKIVKRIEDLASNSNIALRVHEAETMAVSLQKAVAGGRLCSKDMEEELVKTLTTQFNNAIQLRKGELGEAFFKAAQARLVAIEAKVTSDAAKQVVRDGATIAREGADSFVTRYGAQAEARIAAGIRRALTQHRNRDDDDFSNEREATKPENIKKRITPEEFEDLNTPVEYRSHKEGQGDEKRSFLNRLFRRRKTTRVSQGEEKPDVTIEEFEA